MRHCERLCGTAAAIVGVWLAAVPATGQTPPATPKTHAAVTNTWSPARTPDGQPDIQGIWQGGAGFQEQAVELPQISVGDPREVSDCRALGSNTGTPCAPYPSLWATAQRFGVIGGQPNQATTPPRRRGLLDLPDGKLPWTPAGAAKRADLAQNLYNPPSLEYMDPHARCMLPGVPRTGPGGFQFLQIPGYVVLLMEFNHVTRIIPVDGRPHIRPDIRLFMGDSVGRWEGVTLVVDTTNFTGRTWHDLIGTPQSDTLHVVERFTAVDAETIDYMVTIDDPKLFTRPWTFAGAFTRAEPEGLQTTELFEYACAEGARAVENVMERPGKPLPPARPLPR